MDAKCECCQVWFSGRRSHAKYCSEKCANRVRSQRWRDDDKEKELRQTARGKYHVHKTNARNRGIEFKLTFQEWWSIWEPYWKVDQLGKVCMCRTNDEGAYELGNVRIDTWQNNIREGKGLGLLTLKQTDY